MKETAVTEKNSLREKTNNAFRWVCLALFGLSLVFRLVIVIIFAKLPIALDDMYQYDMLGRSLASGKGYKWYGKADVEVLRPYLEKFMPLDKMHFPEEGVETAFRAPGYPLFLSLLYRIDASENRFLLVRVVQAFTMSSMTLMVIGIAKTLGLSNKMSLIAGGIVSFYPMFLFYPLGLGSENIFIPLMTLAVLLTLKFLKKEPSIFYFLLLGIVLGAMILARSVSLLVAAVCVLLLIKKYHKKLLFIVMLCLPIIILVAPWMVHHSKVMGKPANIENSFWYNMFITYHPEGNGNFVSDIAVKPLFILDDAERDAYCKEHALTFIRDNPWEAVKRVFGRTPAFFGPETRIFNYFYSNNFVGNIPQPWLGMIYLLLSVPWFFTCLFGFIGLLSVNGRQNAWLLVLTVILYCLPHLPITTEPRYHLALVPILAPLALLGLTTLRSKWKDQNTHKIYRLAVVGITLFFLAIWAYQIGLDMPIYLKLWAPDGNKHGISY